MFLKQEKTLTVVICKEFHSHQCHNFIQFFPELNYSSETTADPQQRFLCTTLND
jgi:hypothetical protein